MYNTLEIILDRLFVRILNIDGKIKAELRYVVQMKNLNLNIRICI